MPFKNGLTVREFILDDLTWIRPIAEKYGEWEGFVSTIVEDRVILIMVVPQKAVAAIVLHDGKHYGCGLSDKEGVKDLIRLGRTMAAAAGKAGLKLYRNETGKWQNKLLDQLGLEK